jgi:branched-chain amino acid transport system ATP-binding protein
MLTVEGIDAGYGQVQVLRSLSITVGRGERVGLFGPNGHGKTTLLRTISGLLTPTTGSIRYGDRVISGMSVPRIVDLGLIHVPQGNLLFPGMSVLENLTLGAYSRRSWGDRVRNLSRVLELFPRLGERRSQACRTLSGGERQMLAIGVGLMGNPELLMLDEPSLGLAPKVKDELAAAILEIAASGVDLLLVDQDINILQAICQRHYLIEKGHVSLEITPDSRVEEESVLEMYFGKAVRNDA